MSDHDTTRRPGTDQPALTAAIDASAWPDPAVDHSPLGVHLRFTAPPRPGPAPADERDRQSPRPLGIALVIDRSGSMSGAPVEAAKQAAIQLQEQLSATDCRAVIAFDTVVDLVAPLGPIDHASNAGRSRLLEETLAIRRLHGRGGTALTDGWQTGARLLEEGELPEDAETLTVVLSDGYGNAGETDPEQMRRLAAAAASWGVRTSCIGIGERYSTPQLEALCEGGEGTLHQATEPAEIVECVLGELGRIREVSARDVLLEITVPGGVDAEVAGGREVQRERFDHAANHRRLTVRLGDVAGDRTIDVGLLLNRRGAAASSSQLHFQPLAIVARWTDAVTGERREAILGDDDGGDGDGDGGGLPLPTGVATSDRRSRRPRTGRRRDHEVAVTVMQLWHASIIREATLRNEDGHFDGATRHVGERLEAFADFVRGLPGGDELLRTLRVTQRRAGSRWNGRSKKELLVASRKFARGEQDLRAAHDVCMYADFVERTD